jgi:hypothetical protein
MFSRISALWLVVGLVCGYALSGSSATAQSVPSSVPPFIGPGDEVTLQFDRSTASGDHPMMSLRCTVAEIQAAWIRCERDKFSTERNQTWHSLTRLVSVTKRMR